jgi:uncharacterized protein (DUF2164 family)
MAITLSKDLETRLKGSIKKFFDEVMEEEIGDLKAGFLLEFCLKEIGPSVYNKAIADAQARLQEKVTDLDSECYEPELAYWQTSDGVRRGPGGTE